MARILLVDDDIAEISAVKRVLARAGHVAVLATNVSDALASVDASRPELVVLSSTCEDGGAVELAQQLASAADALPLVLLGEAPGLPDGAPRVPRPVDPGQLHDEVTAVLAAATAATTAAAKARPAAAPAASRKAAPARQPVGGAQPRAAPAATPRAAGTSGEPSPTPAGAGDARRAAADALRARAEELRRGPAARIEPSRAAAAPDAARGSTGSPQRGVGGRPGTDASGSPRAGAGDIPATGAREAPRAGVSGPAAAQGRPASATPASAAAAALALEDDDGGLEAVLRRAEEAERANAARVAEQRARAERERAGAEERARAEAERAAAEERARADDEARRAAEDEVRRAHEAEEKAAGEAEARRRAEEELARVREQLEAERKAAEQKLASVMERAAADEEAAEELRRFEEEEARRKAERDARAHEEEEEKLRQAIESARAEMEALRRRSEEEARRRADAEAELRRVAEEARRREALEAEAVLRPAPTPPPGAGPALTPVPGLDGAGGLPFGFAIAEPGARDLDAPPPAPDPAEEAARRRVAALRGTAAVPATPQVAWVAPPAPAPEPDAEPAPRALPPPPPELRAGNLADLPAPRLLALAARAGVTGRLDVRGDVARSVWLEDGRTVGAASADPAERVEEVALRLGLVTRDQHRQIAGAAATLPTRRAAVLLLERGFLKPTELTGLVRRRTEEVVFGIFADAGARFAWVAHEVPADERTALDRGALALAVEGVRRRWLAPRVDALLGGPGTLVAPLTGGPAAAELGLSPEERRVVALADGLRTLDEIVLASPLDALTTRQILAALVLVGTLGVRLLQAGRPQAERAQAIDLARVREKLDQVRRADYFTVLGVGRLCTPHEVREAADRLLADLDPRRLEGVPDETLPAALAEIHAVVKDARDVLADDRLREEYLRGLGD